MINDTEISVVWTGCERRDGRSSRNDGDGCMNWFTVHVMRRPGPVFCVELQCTAAPCELPDWPTEQEVKPDGRIW